MSKKSIFLLPGGHEAARETAFAGTSFFTAAAGAPRPSGFYTVEDQETIAGTVRVHWDILP